MMLNLVLDGNYLLYKNTFILKKLRTLKQDLDELLMNDFKKIIKSYPFDNIYFVCDSNKNNWRRQLYPEYKAQREHDDSIDWQFVFATYAKFKNKIKKFKNVKFFEMDGLEGDDFIGYIVQESNKKGYSNVILSSDADNHQLLKHDLNGEWINFQWNYKFSDERLYLPNNYQLVIEKMINSVNDNIFELDNSSEFSEWIETLISKTNVKSINSEESLFCKIVSGDKGDNVPSIIHSKMGKWDDEGRGIGSDGAKTLYKIYKEIHPEPIDFDSDIFVDRLIDVTIYYKKVKENGVKEKLKENIKLNRMLVRIDTQYMPLEYYKKLQSLYKNVMENVVVYEEEVVEEIEEKFEEPVINDIPENFRLEIDREEFNPDDFWEL